MRGSLSSQSNTPQQAAAVNSGQGNAKAEEVLDEAGTAESHATEPVLEEQILPTEVAKNLISGTSTLGLGVLIERACSFLSNILAARLGGASTFGAYSLAITTANNISTYAAGGIGSTAIRFSGENPRGSAGYTPLARVLAVVALCSAALAAGTLWIGAEPLAKLLHKEALVTVLRWAGFSAAGIIILECCRGFFVGQRRLKALILLSTLTGLGMLTALPIASRLGPVPMLCCQGAIVTGAVLVCLILHKPLQLNSPVAAGAAPANLGHLFKRVWYFSLMQIAGLVGMNIAGWWLTSLVAKSDPTMVQMSFFAVAHQLRNMVALVPSLLIEGSFAEMANTETEVHNTPDTVMAFCTYISVVVSLVVAGAGIIVIPWALGLVYGKTYMGAAAATSLALATAVIHMGSGSASSRLSIVSIKASGAVNTVWAIFVGIVATVTLLHGGDATRGAAVYLAAHILSAILFMGILRKRGNTPAGMITAFSVGSGGILSVALLSILRDKMPNLSVELTLMMAALWLAAVAFMIWYGKRKRWVPPPEMIAKLMNRVPFLRSAKGADARSAVKPVR